VKQQMELKNEAAMHCQTVSVGVMMKLRIGHKNVIVTFDKIKECRYS
jgi:hypothetical protein